MGVHKNMLESINSSIKDSIISTWSYFNGLTLKDKMVYLNNMIEFFKTCKEITFAERRELIDFSNEVKRKISNNSRGYRTISKEKKKLLQKAIEKLIDISTYPDYVKTGLKIYIKFLENN